ncbi:neutral zinc metallopeptidase [Saccharopolyspora rosea]|uniref:Neutral zinc metallopeptidase n=1 Tax=Saccharopolyspora rosea TaxID=524884 RepID=A0ABW3FR13_9PSEU
MTRPPWPPPPQRPPAPPPFPPQFAYPPPAPRPRRVGVVVALVLVGVVVLVGAISAVALGMASSHRAAPGHDVPASGTSAPGTTEPSETTTSATSTAESSEPASTAQRAPQPRPVAALGDNPLNVPGNGAVNTSCDLPPFATDPGSQDAFYQALVPCLMRAWAPALETANMPVRTPQVVTTAADVETPCGRRAWNETAMFCPRDNTIYMTARYYSEVEGRTQAGAYLGQFAHEFGHAIQAMSGISGAYNDASAEAGEGTPKGQELTRRSELQATCYEGMSLAALQNGGVGDDYIFPALQDSANRGDEYTGAHDHGSLATNKTWIDQGFYQNRVTACNTWLAAPSEVD